LTVPIEKLRRLCKAIVEEDDPETLTRLIAELTKHLQQDQNAIKAKLPIQGTRETLTAASYPRYIPQNRPIQ
jgi:hypothetical protein